jgi:sensor c-di-GMP phosphodiesterase-like protein
MRTVFQRVLVIVLSMLALAASGLVGGYLLGRSVSLGQAEARLDGYANRILLESVTSTAESRSMLATMNASPYRFCSDAEIEYFRQLIYQSQFLKAAGRMRDGRIMCSTTAGRASRYEDTRYLPSISRPDGSRVYKNMSPFRVDDESVVSIQIGDSFIVYNPYNLISLASPPMHYALTATDTTTHHISSLVGVTPDVQSVVLTKAGRYHAGNTLFATRCASEYATCTTAFISIPDAFATTRGYETGFMVLGSISGALCGVLLPLLYNRNKSVEQQLIRALRADALTVVYQPIVDLATGHIVEAEALVRWTDEYNNAVSPEVFVQIAEERGFVGDITRLVLRHTLRDFGSTMRARPGFRVSVNIAAADLADGTFIPNLDEALTDAEVSPRNLGIEITESYTARQQVARNTILRLRQKGHYVSIDDFGTGYSSLAYLHDLSVDAIKIDKAFTKAIGTDSVTVSILPQILTMAEALKLRVVVEGIEMQAQADYFAANSHYIRAQGWLYGRPVSARAFLQLLDEEEARQSKQEEIPNGATVAAF